ncbi:DUF4233 domain-containing protein [Carbonactinospora thermoautotrophica]|uniref:DUF4233 domain-containing protein n=1 Tax=Carbonactinospora thermoautotrophica TaxID=1469144 RepID=UPI00226DE917|nr:DUF4233 domain-containing protein [Carbonactinospora thermoautotrophica]MCX9189958.1 DUF4233 domain-containing protein [Carbonactinospora thermoautotrophica]
MRRLAASVLVFEAFVVFFATLVAANLGPVTPTVAWTGGGLFALGCLLLCGLLRFRWAYVVGWALQGALIALGFVIPVMFFLGALFAVLWVLALRVGAKADAVRAAAQ